MQVKKLNQILNILLNKILNSNLYVFQVPRLYLDIYLHRAVCQKHHKIPNLGLQPHSIDVLFHFLSVTKLSWKYEKKIIIKSDVISIGTLKIVIPSSNGTKLLSANFDNVKNYVVNRQQFRSIFLKVRQNWKYIQRSSHL